MCADPALYPWSSYRASAMGDGAAAPWLVAHDLYEYLGKTAATRQGAYRALFDQALGHQTPGDIRTALHQT